MKKGLSLLLAASVALSAFSSAALAADPLTAQEKFDALKAKQIFEGYTDGTAGLDKEMTRAEFATVVKRLLGLEEVAGNTFKDVAADHWANGAVEAGVKAGYFNGLLDAKGNKIFNPKGNVTLQEMAKVFVEVLDLEVDEDAIVEGTTKPWATKYVAAAVKAGLLPESSDYTVPALREALVNASYTAEDAVNSEVSAAATVNANGTVTIAGETTLAEVTVTVNKGEEKVSEEKVTVTEGKFSYTTKALAAGTYSATVANGDESASVEFTVATVALDVKDVEAIANTKLEVTLNADATGANAGDFVIKGSDNAALEVKSVAVSGKSIIVTTAAQTPFSLYTVAVQGKEFKFVGAPADTDKPELTSAVATSNKKVKLTFNEELDKASAENITNYTIAGLTVVSAALQDNKKDVVLTTAAQTQGSIYKVVVANVTDFAGNAVNADKDEFDFGGLPADTTKPELSSAYATSNTEVTVEFNDFMDKATAENIANYTIAGLTVVKAVLDGDNTKKVHLTTSSQTQGTIYKVVVANVADESANVINSDKDEFDFGGIAPDAVAPKLSSAVATANTKVKVTFDDKLDEATAETVANYTIEGLTVTAAELQDNKQDVVLTTSAQTQGTIYKVVAANVKDVAGNVVNADNDEFQFGGMAVDTAKPKVSLATSVNNKTVVVTFDSVVDDATAKKGYNYYLGSELGYAYKAVKVDDAFNTANGTSFDTTGKAYALVTASQGAKVYTVDVTGVIDESGNAVDEDNDTATFGGQASSDSSKPRAGSAVAVNNNTFQVFFNEELDDTSISAADFAVSVKSGSATATPVLTTNPDAFKVASDKKSVTLQYDTEVMTQGVLYQTVVSDVYDKAGNVIDADYDTVNFAGISTTNEAPKVAGAVALNNQTFRVSFSEPVSVVGGDVTLAGSDFTVTGKDGARAFTGNFAKAQLSSDAKSITVYYNNGGSVEAGDKLEAGKLYTVAVNAAKITDELGLVALKSTDSANVGTLAAISTDVSAPKVSAVVAVDKNTIDVLFDQAITSTLVNSDIVVKQGSTTVTANVYKVRAEGDDNNKVRVFFGGTPFSAGTVYSVDLAEAKIVNNNGVAMTDDNSKGSFAAISTDNAAPKLASVVATAANKIKVTFSENVQGVDAGDFTLDGSLSVSLATGSDKEYELTLSGNLTSGQVYELGINAASNILDEAGVGAVDKDSKAKFVK